MSGFNTDLAVTVLARIEESRKPEAVVTLPGWEQRYWGYLPIQDEDTMVDLDLVVDDDGNAVGLGTCNTAYCFAGHALTVNKVKMVWSNHGSFMTADYTESGVEVAEEAADMLGIDREDAIADELWDHEDNMPLLFSPGNSLGDLYAIVAAHAGLTSEALRVMVQARIEQLEASATLSR